MGWECGFLNVKKKQDITPLQYCIIDAYQKWSSITYEGKPDFRTWLLEVYGNKYEEVSIDAEDIDFYSKEEPEDIQYWCSIGRWLDDFIKPNTTHIFGEMYLINNDFVEKATEWIENKLETMKLKRVAITHSFKYNEDGDKVLTKCDGILIEDEEGNQRFIEAEYEDIWVSNNFDEDRYEALTSFKKALDKMQSNEWTFYYRSY